MNRTNDNGGGVDSVATNDQLDLYAVLNLPTDASTDVIAHRSKQLLRSFHPDKVLGESQHTAQQAFVSIRMAEDVLVDPTLRAAYAFGGLTAVRLLLRTEELHSFLEKSWKAGDYDVFYSELQDHLDNYNENQRERSESSNLDIAMKVPFLYDETSEWMVHLPDNEYTDRSFLNISYNRPIYKNHLNLSTSVGAKTAAATVECTSFAHTTASTTISPQYVLLRTTRQLSPSSFVHCTAVFHSALRLSIQSIKAIDKWVLTYGCDVVQQGVALLSLAIRRPIGSSSQLQARFCMGPKAPLKVWWTSQSGFRVAATWQWSGAMRCKCMVRWKSLGQYQLEWGFKIVPQGITLLTRLETARGWSLQLPISFHRSSTSLLAWAVPTAWLTHLLVHHLSWGASAGHRRRDLGRQNDSPVAERATFRSVLRKITTRRCKEKNGGLIIDSAMYSYTGQDISSFLHFWVLDDALDLPATDPRWQWILNASNDHEGYDEDTSSWWMYPFVGQNKEKSTAMECPVRIRYRLDGAMYEVVCYGDVQLPSPRAQKVAHFR